MVDKRINILLVEDDLNLGFLTAEFLENQGMQVKLFRDGESGLAGFKEGKFNFCLLDIMLPKLDGFNLAKKIRAIKPEVPIIFLTAKALKEDKLKGYNIGADDYVTKPFDEDELLCKIKAISNRIDFSQHNKDAVFQIGKFKFDYANQALEADSKIKRLTSREADVLRILCLSKNNIVKREKILISIWGENDYFYGRSLDVFISKLRKYFSDDPLIKIENIPTVGFLLSCQDQK
ncbi:MAG: response regulator transcription factor [Prolixibacteraceae bacterium]|nr:response regulator transcription factor [Prolixibacteraceae bacterium]MBN2773761.1 response regulator transcription factor [Prolixibacteraceae bacterium]